MKLGEGVEGRVEVPTGEKQDKKIITPQKRKVVGGEEKQNNRARTTTNIRKYISCKRWKEKETTEEQTPTLEPPESSHVKGEQTGHYLDRAEPERDHLVGEDEQEKDRDSQGHHQEG